ncbi:DinB family protein [Actinoplanes sp. NEAU-A12]|uniref:DinB family protein n=1 Tax=Actinoplanes sandaracinus TaxID=3045177 RepID=A0ABT6WNK0_9ACTN|nr:DinB family protein [Actinoplanes sandaracinus]MDI6101286.1 DinB family protein [Actinoplanes sandaracinus]
MDVTGVLADGFGRLPGSIEAAVRDLTPSRLGWAPKPGANPIGWLVWHLTRVQDSHVTEITGGEQIYVTGDWAARFGLKADPSDTGYGHTAEQVAGVRPESWQTLVEYYGAVHDRTTRLLESLTPADLDRIVDPAWDPPVTLGVRLVSVLDDDVRHAGQAAYVRGLLP